MADRRAELTDQALDYVLAHGLVGLSLRPLARVLGTSDRMLVYHFGSKDRMLAAVLDRAQERLATSFKPAGPPPTDLAGLVKQLWAGLRTPAAAQITRLYLETCVLAAQDPARWRDAPERMRGPWRAPVSKSLIAFGVQPERAQSLADLILDTFDGLAIDRLTSSEPASVDAAAATFGQLLAQATPLSCRR